jgi:hypothetical protein
MSRTSVPSAIDHEAIVDVMSRYARGIDRRDVAVYRSCFTDVIDLDMAGRRQDGIPADAWVEQAFDLVSHYETTQHLISNHVVEIDRDTAVCRAQLQAQHWRPDGAWLVGGRYEDRLRHTADGWRIERLSLAITWSERTGTEKRA